MTLNAKIGFFYRFFSDFGLRDTFQEQIAPKSIEIHKKKLHRKFLALNVDFSSLSPDPLGLSRPAQAGVKDSYSPKK